MRRKFKSKKRINFKTTFKLLIIIMVVAIFCLVSKYLKLSDFNQIIKKSILKVNSNYSYEGLENNTITNKFYEYIQKNIFNSPTNLLKTELKIESKEKENVSFLYVERPKPLVYIYNSHQGETYSMEYLEEYNIVPDVLMASNMLKDKLEQIGINSIVEENNILSYMKENNLDHSGSYIASRTFLTKAINNYPNVELFIDLHRDAASHSVTLTTINGKPCAKILFVIGLEYDTYEENLLIANTLNNIILKKYPSLTRGIMKKKGYGVNGIYNQDLANNVILIEIGGHENNIEEINNTLELIAEVIGEYLNEKK